MAPPMSENKPVDTHVACDMVDCCTLDFQMFP